MYQSETIILNIAHANAEQNKLAEILAPNNIHKINELKRIYNRLRNQKERHPEQPEYAKQFEEFKQKSKQLEHSYRAGELSESEMMSALDIWKAR